MKPRPAVVAVVAALIAMTGLASLLGGVAVLARATDALQITGGVLDLVVGGATIVVGLGLLRGNRIARVVATILLGARLIASAFGLLASGPILVVSILTLILAVVSLVVLWSPPANTFFRRG